MNILHINHENYIYNTSLCSSLIVSDHETITAPHPFLTKNFQCNHKKLQHRCFDVENCHSRAATGQNTQYKNRMVLKVLYTGTII